MSARPCQCTGVFENVKLGLMWRCEYCYRNALTNRERSAAPPRACAQGARGKVFVCDACTKWKTYFLWKDGLEGKTGRDREEKGTIVSRERVRILDWSTCAFRDIDRADVDKGKRRVSKPKAGGSATTTSSSSSSGRPRVSAAAGEPGATEGPAPVAAPSPPWSGVSVDSVAAPRDSAREGEGEGGDVVMGEASCSVASAVSHISDDSLLAALAAFGKTGSGATSAAQPEVPLPVTLPPPSPPDSHKMDVDRGDSYGRASPLADLRSASAQEGARGESVVAAECPPLPATVPASMSVSTCVLGMEVQYSSRG
jgi:hypothetical protein